MATVGVKGLIQLNVTSVSAIVLRDKHSDLVGLRHESVRRTIVAETVVCCR